jgi:DNA-binding XRE family transcriptional regulator
MEKIIYGLYHPITKKPVYVGKSTVGLNRPWNHINEKSHNIKVNEWVNELKATGMNPVLVVLDQAETNEVLDKKEVFWINSIINDGYPLLNQRLVNPVYFLLESSYSDDDYLSEIRLFVKMKRKELKLTQQELAAKAGVGLRFIRALEQGTKTNFNTDPLYKILILFGVRLSLTQYTN